MYIPILKRVYIQAILLGFFAPLISISFLSVLDAYSLISNLNEAPLSGLEIIEALIIAPLLESVLFIALFVFLERVISTHYASLVVLFAISYLHYFNHWAASIAVIPVFLFTILSYLKARKESFSRAVFCVFIIHFCNNLLVVVADIYY